VLSITTKILTVNTKADKSILAKLVRFVEENNNQLRNVYSDLPTLNDVFLEITGKDIKGLIIKERRHAFFESMVINMFFHVFKYRIICKLHDKPMLLWMLGFPLLMSMFFFLAFANLMDEQETPFEKIDIAVVNISESSQSFLDAAEASDMFNIQKLTETEAEKLLSDGKITAVIDAENDYSITTAKSGTNESVVKLFADKYLQTESALNDIIAGNPSLNKAAILTELLLTGNILLKFFKRKQRSVCCNF
jgi:hypothetical protein